MIKFKSICLVMLFSSIYTSTAAAFSYNADFDFSVGNSVTHDHLFNYTITNTSDDPTSLLEAFSIEFDKDTSNNFANYSSISWVNANSWSTWANDPSGLPAPGIIDAEDLGGGIAQNASLSFSVQFDYSGTLLPEAQLLSWSADFTRASLPVISQSGETTHSPVPLPASVLLLIPGLLGVFKLQKNKKSA